MALTEKDVQLLSRLPITTGQRVLIERRWEQGEQRGVSAPRLMIGRIIMTLGLVALATPLYMPSMARLSNVSLVSLWFLLGIFVLASLYGFGNVFYLVATERRENLLERPLVATLAKPSVVQRIWQYAFGIGLFVITALLGHFWTASGIVLTYGGIWIVRGFTRETVKRALKTLEATEPEPKEIVVAPERVAQQY